jgi:hypothetical protein
VTRLQGRREAVRDLLNEVIWYSRDIEFKFSVQETKRSSLQHLLEGAIQH